MEPEDDLEDHVFGPMDEEEDTEGEDDDDQAGSCSSWLDGVAGYMLLVVTPAVLVSVLAYTSLKTIQYHDLVNTDPRLRRGLLLLNTTCVIIGMTVVGVSVHQQAITN